jgi:hypothetical protein
MSMHECYAPFAADAAVVRAPCKAETVNCRPAWYVLCRRTHAPNAYVMYKQLAA